MANGPPKAATGTLNDEGFAACGGGPIPLRRPQSVRRTTSIDIDWPHGKDEAMRFQGSTRDAATGVDGTLIELDRSWIEARASQSREFAEVRSSLHPDGIAALTRSRAGGKLRGLLRETFPDAAAQLGGHFLLLDDLAGASLVSTWGWLAWTRQFTEHMEQAKANGLGGKGGSMRGICIGLRDGSASLDPDGYPLVEQQNSTPVADLANPDDPDGWHQPAPQAGPATRRARWIDVWREGGMLHAQGGFQDSALEQDGGRIAIHEYRFTVAVDEDSGLIKEIEAVPHVLPHRECPASVHSATRVIGRPLANLRNDVPLLFAGEAGCTHLNDVMRALVCVPMLATHLPQ